MSEHHELVIIGSGPAGFTAALYASRANLDVIIFEGHQPGGQLMITTEVENYPGFEQGIQGPELMDIFRKQANRFGAKSIYESIVKVDFSERPFQMWSDRNKHYTSDAVIISTGATAKTLQIPGEQTYWGHGISACATCDGFFYKGKKIFVVGGGDTAMEEAQYLTHFGESVTIVHRRQEFRASKIMIERVKKNPKINFILDSVIEEYLGEQVNGFPTLNAVQIRNVKTNEVNIYEAGGVFIAIGHIPNTAIFKDWLPTDADGYLITKGKSTYTDIPGVFACGDVQDRVYRQAVTAAGTGCMAAIDAERWLAEHKH
jgi:thioredoxin reductase (NADPH)